jgi:hypothetical protein
MLGAIKTEMVVVTPEMASKFLENNHGNRRLVKRHIAEIRDAILVGEWVTHHQGIAIDGNGRLLDGQHRLAAIVAANTGVSMLVSYNVPETAFPMIDGEIMPRTLAFRAGLKKSNTEVAAFILRAANNTDCGVVRKKDVVMIAKGLDDYMELLQQVAPTRSQIVTAAPARAACVVSMIFSDPVFSLKTYRKLSIGDTSQLPPVGHALIRQILAKKIERGGGGEVQNANYLKFRFVFDIKHQYRTKMMLEIPKELSFAELKGLVNLIMEGAPIKPLMPIPTLKDFA